MKNRLARQFAYNNVEYMRGKSGLIKEMTRSATEWWRSTGRDQDIRG